MSAFSLNRVKITSNRNRSSMQDGVHRSWQLNTPQKLDKYAIKQGDCAVYGIVNIQLHSLPVTTTCTLRVKNTPSRQVFFDSQCTSVESHCMAITVQCPTFG